jgi:hypothetical protein
MTTSTAWLASSTMSRSMRSSRQMSVTGMGRRTAGSSTWRTSSLGTASTTPTVSRMARPEPRPRTASSSSLPMPKISSA